MVGVGAESPVIAGEAKQSSGREDGEAAVDRRFSTACKAGAQDRLASLLAMTGSAE
jgi:hypothetical protein